MERSPWLVCAACGLRHSARPDGQCPRCHATLETPLDAPGAVLRPAPPSLHAAGLDAGSPIGWRIAGIAFILNGIFSALSGFVAQSPLGTSRAVGVVSALLAILLGIGMIRGSEGARKIALALVAIALAGGILIAAASPIRAAGVLIVLFCVAYLLLLLGEPGGGRIAVACLILTGGLALGVLGLTRAEFVAKTMLAWGGEIDGAAVGDVRAGAWRLTFPPGLWYGTRQFAGSAPNVSFERRFLRPDGPAHVMVVSTKVPANRGFDMDVMADAISKATAKQFDEWTVLQVGPLPGRGGTRVLHVQTTLKGEKLEMLCGLFPNPPMFYEVVVGSERSAFARLRPELQGILESFQSETLAREPAPAR